MDCLTRMKYIRLIEKMSQYPVLSRKLGLKNTSCIKGNTVNSLLYRKGRD